MKALLSLLIGLTVVLSSCKEKEEPNEPYVPFADQIHGTWKVVASIDNDTEATVNYPESITESFFTFHKNSELEFNLVCNAGKADRVIVSESGSLLLDGILTTNVICPPNLAATWNNVIKNTVENANHVYVSGTSMTLRGVDDFSLKLKKQ
ncbi:MAG: META domain-containing protein [Bacteroidia bacterium]